MSAVASRSDLAALLARGRIVEVEGLSLRLVVPSAIRVGELRRRMEAYYADHKDAIESKDTADLMAVQEWTDIVAEAVAACLQLEGEEGPCEDEDLAQRLLQAAGGPFGTLAVEAMAQCGIVPKRPRAAQAAAEGEGEAADGDGAREGADGSDPF